MKRPISRCSNRNCKKHIYQGDQVWKHGKYLFCKLNCFVRCLKSVYKAAKQAG